MFARAGYIQIHHITSELNSASHKQCIRPSLLAASGGTRTAFILLTLMETMSVSRFGRSGEVKHRAPSPDSHHSHDRTEELLEAGP